MSWVLRLSGPAADLELLIARLWELGTTGIIEDPCPGDEFQLRAFFPQRFEAGEFAAWQPAWEEAEDKNWVRIIMDSWDPIEVGERFFVAPDWRDDPTPPGRIRLVVRPGVALGTGYHPTTQMCLEAMESETHPTL